MKSNNLVPAALFLLFIVSGCNSSNSQTGDQKEPQEASAALNCGQLDGKSFMVTLTSGGKAEPPEILSFKGQTVESSECLKYGFVASNYSCTEAGDGSLSFETTMLSTVEGKMVWKGSITENQATGTVLWTKEGQADINYTFEGPAK